MSVFHFKRFDVVNEASAMKVNTDGVLLGAAVTLSACDCHVLDAGTGTGTIALMLAQRYSAMNVSEGLEITGIDIDVPSASEASANFAASPWAGVLRAEHCALSGFRPAGKLDLVVSNPPFFEDSLLPPEKRRGMARHTASATMSYIELVDFSREYLSDSGRLSMILPADRESGVVRYAASCGFRPFRILRIRTTPQKAPSRVVTEFSRTAGELVTEELTIQDIQHFPENKNGYTPEYLTLMHDFYLFA